MEKEITTFSIRKDLKELSNKTIQEGKFPGISNLSALIELALVEILKTKGISIEEKEEE